MDTSVWEVNANEGKIIVEKDSLYLNSASHNSSFPYLYTKKDVLPEKGAFSIKVGIQYINIGGYGTGIIFASKVPNNLTDFVAGDKGIWQDATMIAPGGHSRQIPDTKYRVIEFRWLETHYEFYIDGTQAEREPIDSSLPRPLRIWMGNHVKTRPGSTWTSFRIRYIEVCKL